MPVDQPGGGNLAPEAHRPAPQPVDPEVTYLWTSLNAQYVRWEGAKAMGHDQPKAQKMWKQSIFEARRIWKRLMLQFHYPDETIHQHISKWFKPGTTTWKPFWIDLFNFMVLPEDQVRMPQPQRHQPTQFNKRPANGHSNHWDNSRRKRSSISDSEAVVKAQLAMGHYLIRRENQGRFGKGHQGH